MSLLLFFLLAGIDALVRLPARWRARLIARSRAVRQERKRAERELRARAQEFAEAAPWGPPVRTELVDRCSPGGGRNLFDPNPAPRPVLTCVMRIHLHFLADGPVEDLADGLRAEGPELLTSDGPDGDGRTRIEWTRTVRYHTVWGRARG